MQLILDHIGASIIAGTVVLMVVTLQLRAQQNALEEAVFYRGKTHTLEFAELVSDEFPKIGENSNSSTSPIVEYRVEDGRTTEFGFTTSSGSGGSGSMEVHYSLEEDTTVSIETWNDDGDERIVEEIPVYRMERSEDGGAGTVIMTNIRHWSVELMDADGQHTANMAEVRQLRVRLTCLYEVGYGDAATGHRTIWGTTFQPTGLQI